jgi:hypothetical protein
MDSEKQQTITIPLEEYKELLIIKGKYEEYQQSKLVIRDGRKEDGTTINPQTDPILNPIYKITCDCSKHIPKID